MTNRVQAQEHEFLTQVSHARHELRAPINALLGFCEMLLEDAESLPYPVFQSSLQEIQTVSRRLHDAINDLLPPAPKDDAEPDLASLAARARRELRPLGEQVLRIGGTLLVQAQKAPLSAFLTDLDRILAAGYRFLMLLDGTPAFAPAGGANADPLLPPDSRPLPEEQETAILSESAEALHGCRGHVLIVDDNPFNRDILARGLLAQKRHFALAGHGKQALDMLATKAFDLVLLDILMPEMDGFEVLARIMADPELCHTPVIVTCALDHLENVGRCLIMGAADYLTKPFDPIIVRAKVTTCLEMKRLRELERRMLNEGRGVRAEG